MTDPDSGSGAKPRFDPSFKSPKQREPLGVMNHPNMAPHVTVAGGIAVPSLDKGGKITKSGLALVHEGETVVPKSRTADVMSKPAKAAKPKKGAKKSASKKKKKPHKIHISKTANDKFMVEHEFPSEGGQSSPSETHAINSMPELQDHIAEHMGPEPQEQAAPEAAAGAAGPAQAQPLPQPGV